jgi:hypothetical protein
VTPADPCGRPTTTAPPSTPTPAIGGSTGIDITTASMPAPQPIACSRAGASAASSIATSRRSGGRSVRARLSAASRGIDRALSSRRRCIPRVQRAPRPRALIMWPPAAHDQRRHRVALASVQHGSCSALAESLGSIGTARQISGPRAISHAHIVKHGDAWIFLTADRRRVSPASPRPVRRYPAAAASPNQAISAFLQEPHDGETALHIAGNDKIKDLLARRLQSIVSIPKPCATLPR